MNKEYLRWIREVKAIAEGYRQGETFCTWLGGEKNSFWRRRFLNNEPADDAAWHLLAW